MINKLIVLLLSAGLTFLPPANVTPTSQKVELVANVSINVGKQQAVYEKYVCESKTEDYWYIYNVSTIDDYTTPGGISGYTGYMLDEMTGVFTLTGSPVSIGGRCWSPPCPGSCHPGGYTKEGNNLYSYSARGYTDNSTDRCVYSKTIYSKAKGKRTVYIKGDYLEEKTVEAGALPSNGKHTDGYWYVFKENVED